MNHSRIVSERRRRAAAIVLALALGCGFVSRAGAQAMKKLTGHVPPAVASLTATGRLAAETGMRLSIGLPLHNREALTNLLQDLYDPASPSFRRFLTVGEFTKRFGPTEEDYRKVIDFAQSRGLKAMVKHPNRMLVEVTGRAADVEKAFQVTLREYRHPTEDRTFFAPDREPSVDAALPILHISGMDNYVKPRALSHLRAAGAASPASGSGPGGNYAGNDFQAAYVPGTTLTGAGQSVGLMEYAGYYVSDILQYESNYNLPNVPLNNVVLDGLSNVTVSPEGAEQPLDIEMAIAMAPGLSQVIIYYGNSGDDILNRMATDNLAKQLSSSWLYSIDDTTLQIFQELVAQGQNYFNSSGDSLAYTAGTASPTDAPYITCVGGTTLVTSGPGGNWVAETVWNQEGSGLGSSGGVSVNFALPMWQEGVSMIVNQGSTTMRNIPDVALTGESVWVIYDNGDGGSASGTSCAAPLWAGFLALANEQAANNNLPPIGFINPAVYAIGKGSSYATTFHDITNGNNTNATSPAEYFAVQGYDLCTGWGTPQGTNLINALAGVGAPNILLDAAPVALTMTAGGEATVLLTEVAMNTANSSVSLSITNLPSGVTASFNPSSTTSNSILTLTAASTAATGTVTLTITGATASVTNTVMVNLTVLAPAPGATAVSLSSVFNIHGIYTDGTRFSGKGLDGAGDALSANLLASGPSFNGCVFNLGPTAGLDVVACKGQQVTLPAGQYACLNLLAAGVNGNQVNQTFVVNYTDGTSATFIQSFSDWGVMQSYPGQTLVSFMAYNDNSNGTQNTTVSASIYGYSFALNPNKVVNNIELPTNASVMVLAMSVSLPDTPFIDGQPQSLVVTNGGPASFSVAAVGAPNLLYLWQFNGANLADGGAISGSGTSNLTLSETTTNDAGNYVVVISNSYGSVTSAVAVLTVTLPSPLFFSATVTEKGLITFTWTTVPFQEYQVQYTGDLSAGLWTNLGPSITATNTSMTGSDTLGPDPQRFYQVLLVQ
jgi:hypothetical protein